MRINFTCYFAGRGDTNPPTEAGVAIVIRNELTNYIWDIQQHSSRLISTTLGYSHRSGFLPTAAALPEAEQKAYIHLW